MKLKKILVLMLVAAVLIAAVVAIAVSTSRNTTETYKNDACGFMLALPKGEYVVVSIPLESGESIFFKDKEIVETGRTAGLDSPIYDGTVFTIVAYKKNEIAEYPFMSVDGPKYLGENSSYIFGYRMETQLTFPPELEEQYQLLWQAVPDTVITTFQVLDV